MSAAQVLVRRVLDLCPGLDEGGLDALSWLGPDLAADAWAVRLGVPAWVVQRAAGLLAVELRP